MIRTKNEQKTIRLSVCNYSRYQDARAVDEQQASSRRAVDEQQTRTNNNVNNVNNKKKKCREHFIDFSYDSGEFSGVNGDLEQWGKAYPAVDISSAILRAGQWLVSNPTKRKSNYRRFLTNWFSREQERGGSKPAASSAQQTIRAAIEKVNRNDRS